MRVDVWCMVMVAVAGCVAPSGMAAPSEGGGELFDEVDEIPLEMLDGDKSVPYEVPDVPTLHSPEIIVSLSALTVHLFDRRTGFSRVYETGVGAIGSHGKSVTPTGHFKTGADANDYWFYMRSRWFPEYYEGYPFVRLTKLNHNGYATYGFHGPITSSLQRGYVSEGCMRMHKPDIVELFTILKNHPSTPVTIQQEVEYDAVGRRVDVGRRVTLWSEDEGIAYGPSVGPLDERPVKRFVGDSCWTDSQCFNGAFCHPRGFCTMPCDGLCPDRSGYPWTFCAETPEGGLCVQRSDRLNNSCGDLDGTREVLATRFVRQSGYQANETLVCTPF